MKSYSFACSFTNNKDKNRYLPYVFLKLNILNFYLIWNAEKENISTVSVRGEHKPKMYYRIMILQNQFAYFCVFQIMGTC